ncbi:MAG: hypothetical protein ACE5GJ_13370 [Gemmatimonadota bacterium]
MDRHGDYASEAEARRGGTRGGTRAFRASVRRTSRYTGDDRARIKEELEAIEAGWAAGLAEYVAAAIRANATR